MVEEQPKTGFAFHVHHHILVEFCGDYNDRVNDIERNKPMQEQELRLRLFKLIPPNRLPLGLLEVQQAYKRVWQAYKRVWEAYNKVWEASNTPWQVYDKARPAYNTAWQAYKRVWQTYKRVWEAYDRVWEASNTVWKTYDTVWQTYRRVWEDYDKVWEADNPELINLHKELCPDCPFGNNTIFTRRNEKGEWY